MKFRSLTQFKIKGLNQERSFSRLAQECTLLEIDRISQNCSTLKVPFLQTKKVRKKLVELGFEILEEHSEGILYHLTCLLHNWGFLVALAVALLAFIIQSPYIFKYEVLGEENLTKTEIVEFVKNNFSSNKNQIDTKDIETALCNNFEELSFASVIIKGQTLVINVKEKLLPDEIYGEFKPLISDYDGKIASINLISGTLVVSVGDYIKKGGVLVEPYFIDTSGQIKQVEAKATIELETYSQVTMQHYDNRVEIQRTGRMVKQSIVTLFGLEIYKYLPECSFKMFEDVVAEEKLVNNILLPFKLVTHEIYELKEVQIEEKFEDVEQKIILQAQEKALANKENYDKIVDEFYTVKHLTGGITTLTYVVVGQKTIGV